MACLRGISKRVHLFQTRVYPSCRHLIGNKKDGTETASGNQIHKALPQNGTDRLSSLSRERRYQSPFGPVGFGFSSCRYMSSTPSEWSDKVDGIEFAATELIPDGTVEAVATHVPAINEVAVAAADSAVPVAAVQYLIDSVHSFTGLNWWASIVLTTLMIHVLTVPFHLNRLKATAKLNMIRPRWMELRQELDRKALDPEGRAECLRKLKTLFLENHVTPFAPVGGLLIEGPVFVSFFIATRNMAEKVPSLKTGGTLWFTDLSIPDSTYVLPLLAALTFLITVECDLLEGLDGKPLTGTMKMFLRIFAFVLVPVTTTFESALFSYWLTSNLFSLGYRLVLKRPEVKRLLNVLNTAASPSQSQPFSFSGKESVAHAPTASETSGGADRRMPRSAVVSQRTKTLDRRQVKDGKNNKK